MAFKEKAVRRLAEKMNAAGAAWAVMGSWALCHWGIAESWHDLDILVAKEDRDRAVRVLERLGMCTDRTEAGEGLRLRCHFDGTEVEAFIGYPFITAEGREYACAFSKETPAARAAYQGTEVPVLYPDALREAYRLAGRTDRTEAIDAWLAANEPEGSSGRLWDRP